MSALKVSDLVPGTIYREPLSGLRMRVAYRYANDTRAAATYYSEALGRYLTADVRDGELEELPPLDLP